MGWTDPPSIAPGDPALAVLWNTYVRDNLMSLRHLVYIKDTETDWNTSTAANDLLAGEVTIPAGAMGITGAIFVTLIGDYLANSGTPTLTFSVVLGGTPLWTGTTSTFTADSHRRPLDIQLTIGACGATNSQYLGGVIRMGTVGPPSVGIGGSGGGTSIVVGSAGKTAVDMTAAQSLQILATHSVNNAAVSIRTEYATIWVNP